MSFRREQIECAALVADIVGAVAVVVSVVYLAVQIADNTTSLQNEGHFNALELAKRPLELLIADEELAAIVTAGYENPATLSPEEWQRFAMHQVMAFNAWEFLYYAHEAGSIPPNLWAGANAYYANLLRTHAGLVRFWAEYEHIFADPFRSYVASSFTATPVPTASAGAVLGSE
jgi:hypothetical protein